MSTASDVFDQVASFMDDPEKDVFTDAYLTPFLNQCNKRLYQNLYDNPNIQGAKLKVILVNVPQGTNSLSDYITGTSTPSLASLTNIFTFSEKPTGASDSNYRQLVEVQDIPTPISDNQYQYNGIYALSENDIMLPGASQALDMRIFGEFKPLTIVDGTTPLLPNTEAILTHWVCEVVGLTRGSTPQFIGYHKEEKEMSIAELFNSMIMNIQQLPVQMRPYGGGCQEGTYGIIGPGGFQIGSGGNVLDEAVWGP